ncbi:hypothetical protein Lal_00042592 [Lupinus albus]|nr:hypothetical protein Lal_00042592 [Lupinus albus]
MLRQGQMNQQQSFYASYQHQYPNNDFWLSLDEFTARFPIAWGGTGAFGPFGLGDEDTTTDEE